MCQGFSHFSGFLHHFVLAKFATSSISYILENCSYMNNVFLKNFDIYVRFLFFSAEVVSHSDTPL